MACINSVTKNRCVKFELLHNILLLFSGNNTTSTVKYATRNKYRVEKENQYLFKRPECLILESHDSGIPKNYYNKHYLVDKL